MIALHERHASGLGQHIDVSVQQAVAMATQSHILAAAVNSTQIERMSGGVRLGPLNLQLTWPAKDGHVSITFLFGSALGPFTVRLMNYIFEQGFCDEATRDKDWIAYGEKLITGIEPISEFERVKKVVEKFTLTRGPRQSCFRRRWSEGF